MASLRDLIDMLTKTQNGYNWYQQSGDTGALNPVRANKNAFLSPYNYLTRMSPNEQGAASNTLNNQYLGVNETTPAGMKPLRGVMNKAANPAEDISSLSRLIENTK